MKDFYRSEWWNNFKRTNKEKHGDNWWEKLTFDEHLDYFNKKLEFAELDEHKSFPTKAMQKDLLDALNRMYERHVEKKIAGKISDKRYRTYDHENRKNIYLTWEQEEHNKKLWNLYAPYNLHQLREKHKKCFVNEEFGLNEIDLWEKGMFLVRLREKIKEIPVVKRPPKKPKLPVKTPQSAEYKGECQYCGCWHNVRINTGLIADHGYQISAGGGWYYGERTGSCIGRNQLPYQESKDWLEQRYEHEFIEFLKMRKNRGEFYHKHKRQKLWDLKWLRKRIKGWENRILDLKEIEYAD